MKAIFAIIAIAGYIYNIKGNKLYSYTLWLASNTMWGFYNFYNNELWLALMFFVYDIFCIEGLRRLKKKNAIQ